MGERGRIWTVVAVWAGWAAILLALPVLTRARFDLARPDQATSWTAPDTALDAHAGERGAMRLLGPHAQWDSVFYLSIARAGYDDPQMRAMAPASTPETPVAGLKRDHPGWITLNHAFFPLYPWLVRAAARPLAMAGLADTPALVAAGVAVSLAGTLLAMLALLDLARPLGEGRSLGADPADDGLRAAVYLLVWPASVFLAQVYTEGLFVGLSFAALALMRRRRWAWAGALAALAVWTRSSGALLAIPFAWRWLGDGGLWAIRRNERRSEALRDGVLAALPLVAYAAWRAIYGHDFFLVEARYFGRGLLTLAPSWEAWTQAVEDLLGASGPQASAYEAFEALGLLAGVGASLWLLRREPALALYGLVLIGFAMTSGAATGVLRYVLGVPALFLVPARLGRLAAFDRLWTIAGALGLGFFVTAFAFGFWAG